MTDTREPPGDLASAAPATDGGGVLRRAEGISLIGEMAGSGSASSSTNSCDRSG